MEKGFLRVTDNVTQHRKETIGVSDELVFFYEPTSLVKNSLLILGVECTSYWLLALIKLRNGGTHKANTHG